MSSASATKLGVAVIAAAALAGCVTDTAFTDRRDSIALSAGNDTAVNKLTQMVDPWPRASANRNIAFNGQKMQSAVERYRTNKVADPASPTTSSVQYQGLQPVTIAPTTGKP
jgi:hypothetical protein